MHGWSGEGWIGEPDGYLAFAANARIEILTEGDPEGWWLGRLADGTMGWFPVAYTRVDLSHKKKVRDIAGFIDKTGLSAPGGARYVMALDA